MEENAQAYEQRKSDIRVKQASRKQFRDDLDSYDEKMIDSIGQRVRLADVTQIGSKVLIGGGIGLLAGVGGIAVAASAAEIVISGVVTKVAGVIGGALGLSMGINRFKKDRA